MQRASERIRRYRRKTKGCIAPNAFRAIRFAGEKNEDQRTPFERRLKKKRRCHAERESRIAEKFTSSTLARNFEKRALSVKREHDATRERTNPS